MRKLKMGALASVFTSILILTACKKEDRPEWIDQLTGAKEFNYEIELLKGEISALKKIQQDNKTTIDAINSNLTNIRAQMLQLTLESGQYSTITIDPAASQGFGRLDTEVGPVAVILREVKQNADGVKVYLSIGNMMAATLTSTIFHVKWGRRTPVYSASHQNYFTEYNEWQKSIRSTDIKLTEKMVPATWNKVSLALPSTKLSEFGYLELSMGVEQISLARE